MKQLGIDELIPKVLPDQEAEKMKQFQREGRVVVMAGDGVNDAPALARTTEVLKAEGFGVLTTIDVQATLRTKLGREFRKYVILGACNPPLAALGVVGDNPELHAVAVEADQRLRRALHSLETPAAVTNGENLHL